MNERIEQLLTQHNMTQRDLATITHITESAISHYIKGDRTPRSVSLGKIAEALGTTTDYLLYGNEPDYCKEIEQATRLIARNTSKMSKEEKLKIINILMSDDNKEG